MDSWSREQRIEEVQGITRYGGSWCREDHGFIHLFGASERYANWCGDTEDRNSIVGYIFFYDGAPISWNK
jgi:hypothetical protein